MFFPHLFHCMKTLFRTAALSSVLLLSAATAAQAQQSNRFTISGYVRDGGFHVYEQEPDGNRFLMLKKVVFPGEFVLVDNWFSELRDKLKVKR